MLTRLEKHWPMISLVLLIILIVALVFSPASAKTFSSLVLLLGIGMAILFIIRRQVEAYRAGKIDRAAMLRSIFFEVLGLLLAMALAILGSLRVAVIPARYGGKNDYNQEGPWIEP